MTQLTPSLTRLELKFVGAAVYKDHIAQTIALHPAGFSQVYRPRIVHSVYFDTPTFDAFHANVIGLSSRVKVRYRWYGDSPSPDAGQLEIKYKRNSANGKRIFRVGTSPSHPQATWKAVIESLLSQLPGEGRMWLHQFSQPVLINQYHRRYFVSADGMIRVTLDTELRAFDQRYKPQPNISFPINQPRTFVLEVKFAPDHQELASDIIASLPLRPSRHSNISSPCAVPSVSNDLSGFRQHTIEKSSHAFTLLSRTFRIHVPI